MYCRYTHIAENGRKVVTDLFLLIYQYKYIDSCNNVNKIKIKFPASTSTCSKQNIFFNELVCFRTGLGI